MRRGIIIAGVVAAVVGLLALGGVAYAVQGDRTGRPAKGEMLEKLAKRLDLTDAQKTAVQAIFAARRAEVKAIAGEKDLTRLEKRARIVEVFKNTRASVRAVLTPEQQKKFDAICDKVKDRVKERVKERRGA